MRNELMKIIRMRRHLIKIGKSGKNICTCMRHIAKVEPWLNAYPYASDANLRRFARKHEDSFRYLMPSGTNPAHTKISETFQNLIYEQSI